MELVFEWDPRKNARNFRKHRITFDAASTVFADPLGRIVPDEDHSADECREIVIGKTAAGVLVFVAFIEIGEGRIRIISARQATRREKQDYEEEIHS